MLFSFISLESYVGSSQQKIALSWSMFWRPPLSSFLAFHFHLASQNHHITLTLSMTLRYFPFAYKKCPLISKLISLSFSVPFFECLPSLVAEYLECLHWAHRDTFRDNWNIATFCTVFSLVQRSWFISLFSTFQITLPPSLAWKPKAHTVICK